MMRGQRTTSIQRGLQAAGQHMAQAATAAALGGLVDRLAQVASDVAVEADGDAVLLRARGLRARVFGSRRKGPDPQIMAIIGGGR